MRPLEEELEDLPPGTSYPDVAQYFAGLHGRPELINRILSPLRRLPDPTAAHFELLSLKPSVIFTTNYDRLIEKTADVSHLETVTVSRDDHAGVCRGELEIIKVHGDIEALETIVITTQDYLNFNATRPAISGRLKVELQHKTSLFVGYSFRDWDLSAILAQIRRETTTLRPNMYCLQFRPSRIERSYLFEQGLSVIALDADPGSPEATQVLADWIKEFHDRIEEARRRRKIEPAAGVQTNHNLPARIDDFFDRESEMEQVFEGLKSRYPVIVIQGFRGAGKSSLALQVGHCAANAEGFAVVNAPLFEYVVWISAKDKPEQTKWLEEVIDAIAATTGLRADRRLTDQRSSEKQEKRDEVERLIASTPLLLIIDQHEGMNDVELNEWLERVPEPSKVLVTTSDTQPRPKAWPVMLDGLPLSDSLALLRRYTLRLGLKQPERAVLSELATATGGNPQAMKLWLALLTDQQDPGQIITQIKETQQDIFSALLEASWSRLSDEAKDVLRATPLFVGLSSVRADALQAASGLGGSTQKFASALKEIVRFGLLEIDGEAAAEKPASRYKIHPITRSFATGQLAAAPTFEADANGRISAFYLEFLRQHVARSQPNVPYWEALVSNGMREVDREWPAIRQLLRTESKYHPEALVELIQLLVHYLDSRFLNKERLQYVSQAVNHLEMQGQSEEEALLRIDALSWTFVEEDRLEEAHDEVIRGFEIAEQCVGRSKADLQALGYAWRARIRLEMGDGRRASELIEKARPIRCSPWIKARVNMADGDIALRHGNARAALKAYLASKAQMDRYGGEGNGYQILPRIGLAHLANDDHAEAEKSFLELRQSDDIAIGRLYADYGLALIDFRKGNAEAARLAIEGIRDRISRRTTTNLLSKMIDHLYSEIEAVPAA